MHGERRRGRPARVLYWFRTPPGVKVGRAALDEDAIRLLEELNPAVEFDWTRILKGEERERREPRDEARRSDDRRRDHGRRPPPRAARPVSAARGQAPQSPPASPAAGPLGDVQPDVADDQHAPPTPAHARLGAEGVLRLRGRYAALMRRLAEQVTDPVQLEQLRERAERLNPDTWVTADEVTAGLDRYEREFETLRAVVGRRRRRRRHGSAGRTEPPGAPDAGAEPTEDEGPADEGL